MNELAKKAYWDYKRKLQEEKRLTKELMRAADKVMNAEDAEEQEAAYKKMCSIQNALDADEREVSILVRIAIDSLPENLFE